MDNRILCRVLKRIWVSPCQSLQNLETVDEEPREEHSPNTTSNTEVAEPLVQQQNNMS